MQAFKLVTTALALVVVAGAFVSLADLKEWKKLRFELTGRDLPEIQSMDELRATFADPLVCSGCHPEHFTAWSESYHAKSLENAGFQSLYRTYVDYLKREETKTELGRDPTVDDLRQCLFCHAPSVQFASDRLVQQISDAVVAGRWQEIRGVQVSCVVCHSITAEGKWSPESFSTAGTKYGPIRNPAPAARSAHQSQYSQLHTKSEFCAICHSQKPFNVYCSLVYDQFQGTAAARQGKVCQDCHMKARENVRVAVGGQERRTLHSHSFPGGRFKEMWPEALDLNLRAEPRGPNELQVAVTMRSKVPHNIPDG